MNDNSLITVSRKMDKLMMRNSLLKITGWESTPGLKNFILASLAFPHDLREVEDKNGSIVNVDCFEEDVAQNLKRYLEMQYPQLTVKQYSTTRKDKENVYVTNLPIRNFDHNDLKRMFSYFGNILSARVLQPKDDSGAIGFVLFDNPSSAWTAISYMRFHKPPCPNSPNTIECKAANWTPRSSREFLRSRSDTSNPPPSSALIYQPSGLQCPPMCAYTLGTQQQTPTPPQEVVVQSHFLPSPVCYYYYASPLILNYEECMPPTDAPSVPQTSPPNAVAWQPPQPIITPSMYGLRLPVQ